MLSSLIIALLFSHMSMSTLFLSSIRYVLLPNYSEKTFLLIMSVVINMLTTAGCSTFKTEENKMTVVQEFSQIVMDRICLF